MININNNMAAILDNPEIVKDLPRYKNNNKLKASGVDIPLTYEQLIELSKCMEDPIYWIETYCWIVSKNTGFSLFKLHPFQREMVKILHNERRIISMLSRQVGKTQVNAGYGLHYAIFNPDKTVAILAHKASGAKELLDRMKQMYQELPMWMQVGVEEWNKTSIKLGNRCKVLAAATTSAAIRGLSINMLLLDEFSFIPKNQADEFFESVFPTISDAPDSKISIFSTPKGMNHFYRMWMEATEGTVINGEVVKSEYVPFSIKWDDVPGRDETFRQTIIAAHGEEFFEQEYAMSFRGAIGTLLPASALNNIVPKKPVSSNDSLKIYEPPRDGRTYLATIDVARGAGGDYSVINVTDITELPYKQVAVYRNNEVNYLLLPEIAYTIGKRYNDAWILVEINDSGEAVADDLVYNLSYDNLLTTGEKKGKIVLGSWINSKNGVRTTKATKRMGCSVLKAMVIDGKYEIVDFDTLKEASTFVSKANSYEAEEGSNDDIMMCLVIFAWASNQEFFKELCNANFKERYVSESHESMMQDLSPIGYFDGFDDSNEFLIL